MAKKVYANYGTVTGTCGLGVVRDFAFTVGHWYDDRVPLKPPTGGTGFFVAGFINDKVCQAAYEHLTKKHKLIYQSPIRNNDNSGNDFFFCIFDRV